MHNPVLPPVLRRLSLRYLLRHRWQFVLCVLGVALGVAVVVAIDLANASAQRAFSLSTEALAGSATHQLLGGPTGLDETLYRDLRVEDGIRSAAPIVTGYVRVPTLDGRSMQLLGIDALAEGEVRPQPTTGDQNVLQTLLAEPNTVLLAGTLAADYGIAPGDTLDILYGSQPQTVRVVGLVQPANELEAQVAEGILLTDIATAQELLSLTGRLSRIDMVLPDAAAAAEVAALLPPGVTLTTPEARTGTLRQMTAAFELNLTALSLLALIVGIFLIYNTMTFSVVQRRELLGTLRCLGVTRRQVGALVISEALLIAAVGVPLGLLLGVLLGQGLVQLVTRTINDLYFVVTVRALALDPLVLLKGVAVGTGATLLAVALPAYEAAQAAPRLVQRRSALEERARSLLPYLSGTGIVLLLAGGGIIVASSEQAWTWTGGAWQGNDGTAGLFAAFAALFAIVIGCALLVPAATLLLVRGIRPVLGGLFGLPGRMAAGGVVGSLSRTAVAMAALMVAVSVTIGVGTMVGSFRQTVVQWLEQTLVADIYISPPGTTATRIDTLLDPDVLTRFADVPGVAGITRFRAVEVDSPVGPVTMVAIGRDPAFADLAPRRYVTAVDDPLAAQQAGAVFISEPFAYRSGLTVGDTLTLRTDAGERAFPIAAVNYDYASDRGVIQLDLATYRQYWNDDAVSSAAIHTTPSADVEAVVAAVSARVPPEQVVNIQSNRALRESTLIIFDRTFAITAVLQLLATIVAFMGILAALLALQLERARDLALLRATGMTPRQVWGLVLGQTSLMGLTAGVLALPVGLLLAVVLIFVINRRSFGWTLQLAFDAGLFGQALLVSLVAALLAGIYPAFKMSRTPPALALREE